MTHLTWRFGYILFNQTINATMARAKCYHTMDAFVKLVVVLVRYSGDPTNTVTKINLLNKVMSQACLLLAGVVFHMDSVVL